MIKTKLIMTDRNGDCLEVVEDYTECGVTVPKGFRSDGISVPRFLWRFLSPCVTASSATAGVIHDYIYRTLQDKVSRADADSIFYHLLCKYGFGKIRSFLAWLGVRAFGWLAWKTNAVSICHGCTMNCKKCYRYSESEDDVK